MHWPADKLNRAALATVAPLCLAMSGCGQAANGKSAPSPTPPRAGDHARTDRDGDSDNRTKGAYDVDDRAIAAYGHAASRAQERAIAALMARYYAAVAAGDGVAGCALMSRSLAQALAEESSQAGQATSGTARGCATAFSSALPAARRLGRRTGVRAIGARVGTGQGFALLRMPSSEMRDMPVVREGGEWKVGALIDGRLG
jgi:hypothetical protein